MNNYLISAVKNDSCVVQCSAIDFESAEAIATSLRATGHASVSVRMWSKKQRQELDKRGRLGWRAGYVETSI